MDGRSCWCPFAPFLATRAPSRSSLSNASRVPTSPTFRSLSPRADLTRRPPPRTARAAAPSPPVRCTVSGSVGGSPEVLHEAATHPAVLHGSSCARRAWRRPCRWDWHTKEPSGAGKLTVNRQPPPEVSSSTQQIHRLCLNSLRLYRKVQDPQVLQLCQRGEAARLPCCAQSCGTCPAPSAP